MLVLKTWLYLNLVIVLVVVATDVYYKIRKKFKKKSN